MYWFQVTLAELNQAHELTVFTTGLAALDHFRSNAPPDVVVMDWRLPMLEPEEFVRWMRAVPRYERVPLIVCSGSAKHCREQALAVGAVACLEKPVDRVQLQAIFEVIS